jgi:[phosphatase 2A protein]-leucine-carboxy methyltransferase
LINVGTYLRTQGIDHIVDQFLEAAGEEGGQIVSLGAGSDSRFWKLRVSASIKLSVAVDCKRMMKGAEGSWRAKEIRYRKRRRCAQ